MALEFDVLGPIEVRRDGQLLKLGGAQQRRILAVLLSELDHVVSVDRLVDTAWSGEPPRGGRRTVMTYVSRLRAVLGDGHVATRPMGYQLTADAGAVDALRFERAVERARSDPPTRAISALDDALRLWRGPAFGEFADEWWALPHASRLEEMRLVAAELRVDSLLATGAYDRAVTDLEPLVLRAPLRERFAAQLMTAYDASGRQAEALRAFTAHREHVVDATGLEPSPELRALEASILQGHIEGAPSTTRQSTRGYVLGPLLGEGSSGGVYRATQPGVGREVAVKVIRSDLADDIDFVRRFEAEAQLVAHLEHPHIVPLYDFWREPGGAYLVFRLMRGGSLEQQPPGPWSLERVDQLVTEVGGALVAAHAAGVVHRDVKPANILFDEQGRAYLADFGLAFGGPDTDGGGDTGWAAGTAAYAAPEQFRSAAPSAAADQYSFATTIWELLAGEPATTCATTTEVLRDRLRAAIRLLGTLRPDVPDAIDAVLQRATAPDAQCRFPDVAAFVGAWRAAVRVAHTTTGDLSAAPLRSTAPTLAGEIANPYKGLRPFCEADARRFFGRDVLVDRLAGVVAEHAFVTVVGPSGCGKSSLVHAGLVPRLRSAGIRVVTMVPGADPLGQLRIALRSVALTEPTETDAVALVRSVVAEAPPTLALVIDQFEELWTLAGRDDREQFATVLADLAGATVPMSGLRSGLRIVATIRADFFDRPLADSNLGPLVAAEPFAVTPMTAAELSESVVAPAAALGVRFEPGLDSAIVAEVAGEPGSLPLLQFALTQLFELRRGVVITRESFDAIGGVAGAIAGRAEEHWSSLDDAGRAAIRNLMLRLVVPGDGVDDTRRRVRISELPPALVDAARDLEAHRLLVADRDPATREPTFEIAHESLLRSWPRVSGWLAEDRDLVRRIRHIGVAASAWEAGGRPEGELYRGARLAAADDVLETAADQLAPLEREFVVASRAAADTAAARERRVRRRLRRGIVATSVALVAAVVAGVVALQQRRDADRDAEAADVARLVSTSGSLIDTKRDVAALLALEASLRAPGPATTSALATVLFSDPTFLGEVWTGTDFVGVLGWDPGDGQLYAVGGAAQPRRIDPTTRAVSPVAIEGWGPGDAVDWFVPVGDGTALLARVPDGAQRADTVERIDLDDGRVIAQAAMAGLPLRAVVSPDRRRAALITWAGSGEVGDALVLDIASMQVTASVPQPGPPPEGFSAGTPAWLDDERIVVGSPSGRLLVWQPDGNLVVARWNDPPAPGPTDANVLSVSDDGQTLVLGGGSSIMAFDTTSGEPRWVEAQDAAPVIAIDSTSDTVWAQEAGFGSSRLFPHDLDTGRRLADERDVQYGSICDARTSPDGRLLAVASCNEGVVALWSLDGASAHGRSVAPEGWATAMDMWSPDGDHVAIFRPDDPEQLVVVDVRDGSRHRVERAAASASNSPAFRADGVLMIVDQRTSKVLEYDPDTQQTVDIGIALPSAVSANVAIDGDRIAYGLDDGRIVVVDTRDRRVVTTISTDLGAVFGLGWSRDGARLFAGGQSEEAQVLDVGTGRRVATLSAPAGSLAVSPDRTVVVGGAFDGSITLFDAESLQPIGSPLTAGTSFAAQIQFTPDGRTILVSGLDSTIRLIDVDSQRQIGGRLAVTSWGAAIAPDSSELAVSTEHGVLRLALDDEELRESACRIAGRNLNAAEWEQHIGGTPEPLCTQWP